VELSITDEEPSAQDVETISSDGLGAIAVFDGGTEQQSGTSATSPAENTRVDGERAPVQAATVAEAVDQPAPSDHKNADVDETAALPPAEDSRVFDDPGNEPEGVPSRADSRAGAAAANGELVEKPTFDNTDAPPEQTDGAAPATEVQNTPTDTHTKANDQLSETPQAEHDGPVAETAEQQMADDWPWADEFAARAQARENAAAANAEQADEPPANDSVTDALSETRDSTPGAQNPSDFQAEPDQSRADDGSQMADPAEKATEALGGEDRPVTEFMVGDKLVRIRDDLDPVRGHVDSGGAGDAEPEPAGDRIASAENDEQSRLERLRKKFYEASEDVRDGVRKTSDAVQDLLPRRPPTGHPETRTGPVFAQAEHHGVDAGDTATALLATGFVIVEVGRWIHGKLGRKKEGHSDGRDR
jgi:hypothetical protein